MRVVKAGDVALDVALVALDRRGDACSEQARRGYMALCKMCDACSERVAVSHVYWIRRFTRSLARSIAHNSSVNAYTYTYRHNKYRGPELTAEIH